PSNLLTARLLQQRGDRAPLRLDLGEDLVPVADDQLPVAVVGELGVLDSGWVAELLAHRPDDGVPTPPPADHAAPPARRNPTISFATWSTSRTATVNE